MDILTRRSGKVCGNAWYYMRRLEKQRHTRNAEPKALPGMGTSR